PSLGITTVENIFASFYNSPSHPRSIGFYVHPDGSGCGDAVHVDRLVDKPDLLISVQETGNGLKNSTIVDLRGEGPVLADAMSLAVRDDHGALRHLIHVTPSVVNSSMIIELMRTLLTECFACSDTPWGYFVQRTLGVEPRRFTHGLL